jgi:hypothetical protein
LETIRSTFRVTAMPPKCQSRAGAEESEEAKEAEEAEEQGRREARK